MHITSSSPEQLKHPQLHRTHSAEAVCTPGESHCSVTLFPSALYPASTSILYVSFVDTPSIQVPSNSTRVVEGWHTRSDCGLFPLSLLLVLADLARLDPLSLAVRIDPTCVGIDVLVAWLRKFGNLISSPYSLRF
jgi:hypothetical protein